MSDLRELHEAATPAPWRVVVEERWDGRKNVVLVLPDNTSLHGLSRDMANAIAKAANGIADGSLVERQASLNVLAEAKAAVRSELDEALADRAAFAQALLDVVDAQYGMAYHHIGDGDGLSKDDGDRIRICLVAAREAVRDEA